ncbi:MAG TPA: hypothetical protein VNR64_19200 [Vicinamibacterales bacterium]|nr:hypothetical protein [Vicinamibacterales bacterium]
MNLAVPALVLFLGILPGVCCFYAYFAGRFDKRTAGVSATEELALYIVFAIPLDILAYWLFRCWGFSFDFGVATHLLAGDLSDAAIHNEIASYFQRFLWLNAWTYFLLLCVSCGMGSLFRRVVWASRLDVLIPYLHVKHEWFYILQGRLPGKPRDLVAFVDVLTKLPDADGSQTRLFRGVVIDFQISPAGGIETLTLGEAKRGKDRGDAFHWKPIPSDRLVLMGMDIHSINVTYVSVETELDHVPTFWDRSRRWWRSFLLEEC